MAHKLSRYQARGFQLISKMSETGIKRCGIAAATTITRGNAILDDGNGFVGDAGADIAATLKGIAAETVVNAGAAGAADVAYYPLFANNQYSVPCDTVLIAQTDIQELCDLGGDSGHINPADAVATGIAFVIDDIDVSAEALAANAFGFAIGHFEVGRVAQT